MIAQNGTVSVHNAKFGLVVIIDAWLFPKRLFHSPLAIELLSGYLVLCATCVDVCILGCCLSIGECASCISC